MVEIRPGVNFSINPLFKEQLDILLSDVKYDQMDLVLPITGLEGWGKSKVARDIGLYAAKFLGSKCDVDDIEFDLDEYINHSVRGPTFKINILDESRRVAGKGKVRDPGVEKFLDYISECRKRQQVHIICIPAYHDLKGYIVKWRAQMILQLRKNYVKDATREGGHRMQRGEYRVYTDKKELIYYYDHPYQYPKHWEVRDWWTPVEMFTPEMVEAYNAKKDHFMLKKYVTDDEARLSVKQRALARREVIPRLFNKFPNLSRADVAELFKVDVSQIGKDISGMREESSNALV